MSLGFSKSKFSLTYFASVDLLPEGIILVFLCLPFGIRVISGAAAWKAVGAGKAVRSTAYAEQFGLLSNPTRDTHY